MNIATKELFTTIEKGFNIAGTIPVISFFSGMIRAIAGKIQMIAGAILSTISYVALLVTNHPKWNEYILIGNEFILHGALNILRGIGEASLCATTIVGNIALLIPNMNQKELFGPYFTYGMLTDTEINRINSEQIRIIG